MRVCRLPIFSSRAAASSSVGYMIKPLTWGDVCYVAARMKPDQARSACALADTDDPLQAVQGLANARYVGGCIWKGEPIAVAGAVFNHPGVASTFMFATVRWPEVVLEVTRFIRRTLIPALEAAGIHRLQSLSFAGDTRTNEWKERIFGGSQEAVLTGYGRNREDFVLYVRHLGRVTHVVN